MHKNFFKFDKDFRTYKAHIIEKDIISEEIFNGTSVDELSGLVISNYQYNDAWAGVQMTRYDDVTEKLDDGLEEILSNMESKTNQGTFYQLVNVANSEFSAIKSNVKELQTKISELTNGFITLVSKSVFDEEIEMLSYRLTVDLTEKVNSVINCSEDQADDKERILFKFERFLILQQDILDSCSVLLNSKVRTDSTSTLGHEFSLYGGAVHPTSNLPNLKDLISSVKPSQIFHRKNVDFHEAVPLKDEKLLIKLEASHQIVDFHESMSKACDVEDVQCIFRESNSNDLKTGATAEICERTSFGLHQKVPRIFHFPLSEWVKIQD